MFLKLLPESLEDGAETQSGEDCGALCAEMMRRVES